MIPPEIQGYKTYIICYSGGKDSTATLLWALDNLPYNQLQAVFCDTGAEWPETYKYLEYVEHHTGIAINRIKPGKPPLPPKRDGTPRPPESQATSLSNLCSLRQKWPTARARSCTTYLKFWPLRLYGYRFANPIMLEGTRREESKARAQYPQFQHSFNSGLPVYRPIHHWSLQHVWDYLRTHHILPNPIYNYVTRCGCWCCIMAPPTDIFNFCRIHPAIAQKTADLEQQIRHNWPKHHGGITNLLRQAQAQIPLFNTQPRFPTLLPRFDRTASEPNNQETTQ